MHLQQGHLNEKSMGYLIDCIALHLCCHFLLSAQTSQCCYYPLYSSAPDVHDVPTLEFNRLANNAHNYNYCTQLQGTNNNYYSW